MERSSLTTLVTLVLLSLEFQVPSRHRINRRWGMTGPCRWKWCGGYSGFGGVGVSPEVGMGAVGGVGFSGALEVLWVLWRGGPPRSQGVCAGLAPRRAAG